jgi:hypothetical protein
MPRHRSRTEKEAREGAHTALFPNLAYGILSAKRILHDVDTESPAETERVSGNRDQSARRGGQFTSQRPASPLISVKGPSVRHDPQNSSLRAVSKLSRLLLAMTAASG